jgi:hypothetical protein
MSQGSSPGAPERDLNATFSSSELRVLRAAVNAYLYLAPTGELPKEAEILGPLGEVYAKRLAAGQPPQPPQAPLEGHHRPPGSHASRPSCTRCRTGARARRMRAL